MCSARAWTMRPGQNIWRRFGRATKGPCSRWRYWAACLAKAWTCPASACRAWRWWAWQVCPERELLRSYYQQALGDGFGHAYRYPGMNKVLQAVGRLIRTETDRGVALLLDDRFSGADYAALMPPWWGNPEILSTPDGVCERAKAFWQAAGP